MTPSTAGGRGSTLPAAIILALVGIGILAYVAIGYASAFGGASSQAAFGARSGATVLSRATWICAAIFILGALALGILGRTGPGSVVGGRTPLTQPSGPTPSPFASAFRIGPNV